MAYIKATCNVAHVERVGCRKIIVRAQYLNRRQAQHFRQCNHLVHRAGAPDLMTDAEHRCFRFEKEPSRFIHRAAVRPHPCWNVEPLARDYLSFGLLIENITRASEIDRASRRRCRHLESHSSQLRHAASVICLKTPTREGFCDLKDVVYVFKAVSPRSLRVMRARRDHDGNVISPRVEQIGHQTRGSNYRRYVNNARLACRQRVTARQCHRYVLGSAYDDLDLGCIDEGVQNGCRGGTIT